MSQRHLPLKRKVRHVLAYRSESCSRFVPDQLASFLPVGARRQKVEGQIVVGTPGTVMDLARKRMLNMQHIKIFVLDEADAMLDKQSMGDQSIRVKK